MFELVPVALDDMLLDALVFRNESLRLSVHIPGPIENSVTNSPERLLGWKRRVMRHVLDSRGTQFSSEWRYSITVGFRFHPSSHGNQKLDLDNYIKPVLDGLAAGLFCTPGTDPESIKRFHFDDSNFRTLVVHRLADAEQPESEAVGLVVSVLR